MNQNLYISYKTLWILSSSLGTLRTLIVPVSVGAREVEGARRTSAGACLSQAEAWIGEALAEDGGVAYATLVLRETGTEGELVHLLIIKIIVPRAAPEWRLRLATGHIDRPLPFVSFMQSV